MLTFLAPHPRVMSQLLLIPDPKPLLERLGPDFFRHAPQTAGVYLMRDSQDQVLYVGKAKNLRRRLGNYRVANPDRMPRRHLRMLRAVSRIDLEECQDEQTALNRESELLRSLRPRFNRAGTWPGKTCYLGWRWIDPRMELSITDSPEPGWTAAGPLGGWVVFFRAALMRLLWCALWPAKGAAELPEGWFRGRHGQVSSISLASLGTDGMGEAKEKLRSLFGGDGAAFCTWVKARSKSQTHPFESSLRDEDLEWITDLLTRVTFPTPAVVGATAP